MTLTKPQKVTPKIMAALNKFKIAESLPSNYALAKELNVSAATISTWYNKRNIKRENKNKRIKSI